MPRHPPCALKHFNHNKMLASTMQHSTHNHTPIRTGHHHAHNGRVRQPRSGAALPEKHQPGVFSGPNSVPNFVHQLVCDGRVPPSCVPSAPKRDPQDTESEIRTTTNSHTTIVLPCTVAVCLTNTVRLLRKEVIQPHLPVRLPCYDFVPIASPTFDNSLPQAG
jgi:hypothetical protein